MKVMSKAIFMLLFFMAFQNVLIAAEVIAYTTLPEAEKSKVYTLKVNGKEIFVEKFKDISYARFAFSGNIKLELTASKTFSSYIISPKSYEIPSRRAENTILFDLSKPRKLILQLENVEEKLFIFADAPEQDKPKLGDQNVTNLKDYVDDHTGQVLQTKQIQKAIDYVSAHKGILYVPNGKYLTGTLIMKRDVTLYLESGAIIQGSGNLADYNDNGDNKTGTVTSKKGALIYFDKAENAKIIGRGVIAMQGTKIKTETNQKIRVVNIRESNNSEIHDIIIRDSGGFTVHILNSNHVTMKGYKIINDLSLVNEDGTDPDGCDGVLIEDVFMYTSDDAVAVKADHRLCQNVLVKDCVFWTVKSALKVGSDPANGARNIVFQNNDVVHADRALALYVGKGFIENVKFIDNKSEFVGGNAKRQLIVFQVSNSKENHTERTKRGIGYIKGVEVKNYTAYQQSQNKSLVSGTIAANGNIHKVSDVVFDHVVIEGKHILSAEQGNMIINSKELPKDPNLTFKQIQELKKSEPKNAAVTTENIVFK
ncbi:glycoside hydrolase family 28 [Pseudopedobacter saltans DSM 12145]|uniref:Glycoside hydrolase family 28 n=1 Tax=Pseudopedobacter saltans (strain ATCC 51119 / DSM 12145 / JCM 21818 / CCUG 39354 / LMG 10337 / NBRC 100064 / NCIMB 13643) TaxID=762903 RepID=F0S979_PSESL|nr:glycosyl hydrolase family 28 protein [Pseudopedobacter saltans]ADY51377.1 glycoside hydrolase family 28 [Pseudopedobacter saltans DSM 12145]